MRERLRTLLDDFNAGRIQISDLHSGLERLLKAGLHDDLTKKESAAVRNVFAWGLDMYDPNEQPRSGVVGRLRDVWDQVFHGTYRVSEKEIKRMCNRLTALLEHAAED